MVGGEEEMIGGEEEENGSASDLVRYHKRGIEEGGGNENFWTKKKGNGAN